MRPLSYFKPFCLLATLLALQLELVFGDGCACEKDQKIKLQLTGIAKLAGHVTVEVWVGESRQTSFVLIGAPVVWDGSRYYADTFQCVQWPVQGPDLKPNVTVEPHFDEPVKIRYIYETDDSSPDYTEFDLDAEFDGIAANPVVYLRKPSTQCPTYHFTSGDFPSENSWVEETHNPFISGADTLQLKVHVEICDKNAGDGQIVAGMIAASPDPEQFADSEPWGSIMDKCPDDAAVAAMVQGATTTTTSKAATNSNKGVDGKSKRRTSIVGSVKVFEYKGARTVDAGQTSALSQSQTAQATTTSVTSAAVAPYALTDQIGSLTWEMSLGSIQRQQSLGSLRYEAKSLDGTELSPQRLSLAEASSPWAVLRDDSDNLRQIEMSKELVDITSTPDSLLIKVFAHSQIAGFDNGVYVLDGDPMQTWTITSPNGPGSVRFTRSGSVSETHEAHWQGTAGVAGTMTISRFGGKWKEECAYLMGGGGTQRTETISQYKNNVLQHKVRYVYQQFDNWGEPGEVFEALIQKVEDLDGQALTTTYEYWDTTAFAVPGNQLLRVAYPDGYKEWRRVLVGNGGGSPPIYTDGDVMRMVTSYKDQDPGGSTGRDVITENVPISSTQLMQKVTTKISNVQVGYKEIYHDFSTGYWVKQIFEAADETGQYTYKEDWSNPTTHEPLFVLETDGTSRDYFYSHGYWDPASQSFGTSPGPGHIPAKRIRITHGTAGATGGIANKTTIDQTVEDQFGRTVLEETYVNTGSGVNNANLIDRKVHTWSDGRLVATEQNGRTIYEAGYYPDGLLQWEEGETGQRIEFVYDEDRRVSQKTIRGRGGDADKVISYEHDVFGNIISEQTSAGGLTTSTSSHYNLAGELDSKTGIDGLTTSVASTYTGGFRVVAQTLPTQATQVTSYFRDREPRSITGTAVEDLYFNPFLGLWTATSYREAVSIYRDSAMTQLKQTRLINWLGNEILVQTKQFQGVGNRNRYTTYDNSGGQTRQLLVKIEETGHARRMRVYDALGRLTKEGLDMDNSGTLDNASVDRITTTNRSFEYSNGIWQDVLTTERQLTENVDAPVLFQRTRTNVPASLAGNTVSSASIEQSGGGTITQLVTLDRASGTTVTTIQDLELGQSRSRIERDELLRSATEPGISTPKSYTYTALGEIESIVDPITGTVTYSYDAVTRRVTGTTDSLSRQTLFSYYPPGSTNAGLLQATHDPSGNASYQSYAPTGKIVRQWGTNIYPVEVQYNEAQQMTQMKTFRSKPGDVNWASSSWPNPPGGDVTQWAYDSASELLERKVYADSRTVSYTYTNGDYIDTKINARGQTIDYSVDLAGQLTSTVYSDNTPQTSISFDRAGRYKNITDASGSRSLTWNARDQLQNETWTAGELAGQAIVRDYDSNARLESTEFRQDGQVALRQRIAYDSISWVDYISDEAPIGGSELHRFDYTFKPGTPFVQSIEFTRAGTPIMKQIYTRDSLGRLAGAAAALTGGQALHSVDYHFDELNRRDKASWNDGTFIDYAYNPRSEVTSARKQFSSGTFVGGSQHEFTFDDVGNPLVNRFGGDASGLNLRTSTYAAANNLNQPTSRTVPNSIFVSGAAPLSLTLQGFVDQQSFSLSRQQGETFFGEAQLDNTNWPIYSNIKVSGKDGTNVADLQSGFDFLKKTPEAFTFDADGNQTGDGRWALTWDADNRLIQVETLPEAAAAGAPKVRLRWSYDSANLRYKEQRYTWTYASGWQLTATTFYIHDGCNLIAELNQTLNPVKLYQWGLDLSGTRQGAGGVGGLLEMKVPSNSNVYYYTFDGNGNVRQLVDAQASTTVAEFDYSPFGETTKAVGPMADLNRFRFSTKFEDLETRWLYYGQRYLDPALGRWLSLDPFEAGANLYSFVENNTINQVDPLGLVSYTPDSSTCTIDVLLKMKPIWIPGQGGQWDDASKNLWMSKAIAEANSFYSGIKNLRCKNLDCPKCPDGYKINFNLQFVQSGADLPVYIKKGIFENGSAANPHEGSFGEDDVGGVYLYPRYRQVPDSKNGNIRVYIYDEKGNLILVGKVGAKRSQPTLIHEIVHILGIKHPGAYKVNPPVAGTDEDYGTTKSERGSITGAGTNVRPVDFGRLFCDKLKGAGGRWITIQYNPGFIGIGAGWKPVK